MIYPNLTIDQVLRNMRGAAILMDKNDYDYWEGKLKDLVQMLERVKHD